MTGYENFSYKFYLLKVNFIKQEKEDGYELEMDGYFGTDALFSHFYGAKLRNSYDSVSFLVISNKQGYYNLRDAFRRYNYWMGQFLHLEKARIK